MFRSTLEEHEQVDPAEALMREVGAQLREVRLERGEDLHQVAENLRIRPAYLEGIERGDLSVIPGRAYALGFLRSYAKHLGFDGDDLVRQIKSTVENLTGPARLHIPTPLPESRVPKTSLVLLSLALVGGVYAGWMYVADQQRQLDVETVAEVPDDLRRLALGPPSTATSRQQPQRLVTAPETAGDRRVPAQAAAPVGEPFGASNSAAPVAEPVEASDPAAPVAEPVEGSDVESAQGVAPEIQAGVGDRARSGEEATSPPAMRQSRATAVAAAEMRAAEPSGIEPPTPVIESGAARTPDEATGPGSVVADRALDQIIERDDGERAGSAEATGDARSPPGARDATAGDDAGRTRPDEANVAPDAGPAEEAGLEAERPAPRKTAEEVLAAPGPTGTGSEVLQIHERENTDARVVLRARGRSWIRIASAGGDYISTRTLEEGDVFLVPDRADLTLWTGNAGGLQVIVDGQTLPPLGPDGAVKRDVPLDPRSLLAQVDAER